MLYVAWSPVYAHPLPAGHRFPMAKYELLPEQLLYEGTLKPANFFEPQPMADADILLTHDAAYLHRLHTQQLTAAEIRKTGFPLSPALVQREVTILQGSVDGALRAMQHGVAFNIAGGTHHAYANRGEGFCLLNDIAAAANVLLHRQLATRILVVDLDVHQGNGTAHLFAGSQNVFTFSMHGAKNYPMHKEQSYLDVELPDGITDKPYLALLEHHLPRLMDTVEPDFVFYQAGVDILATDKLGRLAVSRQGCALRDRMVFETCRKHKVPVAVSMGGGYSAQISDIVEAHANTYRVAMEIYF
ncbi:MAG: histone deacetylase [Bacteroidia bacterium]|jgi:acetoin utilization deacetylase AcuC-like enzyme|nr:histone deacetylase [Bacteroidia bacterium]